jgi:hypothetical protein
LKGSLGRRRLLQARSDLGKELTRLLFFLREREKERGAETPQTLSI